MKAIPCNCGIGQATETVDMPIRSAGRVEIRTLSFCPKCAEQYRGQLQEAAEQERRQIPDNEITIEYLTDERDDWANKWEAQRDKTRQLLALLRAILNILEHVPSASDLGFAIRDLRDDIQTALKEDA